MNHFIYPYIYIFYHLVFHELFHLILYLAALAFTSTLTTCEVPRFLGPSARGFGNFVTVPEGDA